MKKRIPIAAGLAGGSTDCAAVLRGLNRLWKLSLSQQELCRIGAKLGADVPFCICGGTMRGTGIGEQLRRLPSLPSWPVVVLHPRVAVQTKRAYALFDGKKKTGTIDVDAVEAAIRRGHFESVTTAMGNTFEELVMPDVPQVISAGTPCFSGTAAAHGRQRTDGLCFGSAAAGRGRTTSGDDLDRCRYLYDYHSETRGR